LLERSTPLPPTFLLQLEFLLLASTFGGIGMLLVVAHPHPYWLD